MNYFINLPVGNINVQCITTFNDPASCKCEGESTKG